MRPNSVFSPVAKTTAPPGARGHARAHEDEVRHVDRRQLLLDDRVGRLAHASDSPVRAMSFVETSYWRTRLASALMLSASSRAMTSPGTRSAAATMVTSPSRTTLALAGTSFCSASVAFSARYSWKNPMVAFSSTTAMIAMVTLMLSWRLAPVESMAAMNDEDRRDLSMIAKRLVNWSTNRKRWAGRPWPAARSCRAAAAARRPRPRRGLGRGAQRLVDAVVGERPDALFGGLGRLPCPAGRSPVPRSRQCTPAREGSTSTPDRAGRRSIRPLRTVKGRHEDP